MITFASSAQEDLIYSIKGGVNYSRSYTGSQGNGVIFGMSLGATIEKKINNNFGLQGELLFNQKGVETVLRITNPASIVENNLGYIDIPILIQFKILKNLTFQAGPQFGITVLEDSTIEGEEVDLDINTLNYGLVGGFEINLYKQLFMQLRYEYGLNKIDKNDVLKFSVISFHLGYSFD